MKRKAEDTARQYFELKRSISGRTGLADDSPGLDYLAMLQMQIEHTRLRLINGDSVTSAELLALQTAVNEMSPEPVHEVRIQVSKRLHGVCKHCGKLSELGEYVDGKPPPAPPLRLLPPPSAVSEGVENA
jgi:hypothetical protein